MQVLKVITILLASFCSLAVNAQELNAKVTLNYQQVQGTSQSIFENLKSAITEFLNERHWTNQQYAQHERINCSFNITISEYQPSSNSFKASLLVQSTRPVYNSTYNTTVFSIKDGNCDFTFQEFDKLDFRVDQIDNALTAFMAYYVYLLIGLDMDTMAPEGGTEMLQTALSIVNNAQGLNTKGWKPFEDDKNRFAIINDYLDTGMASFRQMQYQYHRNGLDEMAGNSERGRNAITEAIMLLKKAHADKPLSQLPMLFTEYKRNELVDIYYQKGNPKEKETIKEILTNINASQTSYWSKLAK